MNLLGLSFILYYHDFLGQGIFLTQVDLSALFKWYYDQIFTQGSKLKKLPSRLLATIKEKKVAKCKNLVIRYM